MVLIRTRPSDPLQRSALPRLPGLGRIWPARRPQHHLQQRQDRTVNSGGDSRPGLHEDPTAVPRPSARAQRARVRLRTERRAHAHFRFAAREDRCPSRAWRIRKSGPNICCAGDRVHPCGRPVQGEVSDHGLHRLRTRCAGGCPGWEARDDQQACL